MSSSSDCSLGFEPSSAADADGWCSVHGPRLEYEGKVETFDKEIVWLVQVTAMDQGIGGALVYLYCESLLPQQSSTPPVAVDDWILVGVNSSRNVMNEVIHTIADTADGFKTANHVDTRRSRWIGHNRFGVAEFDVMRHWGGDEPGAKYIGGSYDGDDAGEPSDP